MENERLEFESIAKGLHSIYNRSGAFAIEGEITLFPIEDEALKLTHRPISASLYSSAYNLVAQL